MAVTTQMRTDISKLYVALFQRAPDGEGLGYWVTQLSNGTSLTTVANDMYAVSAARTYYPAFATNAEIVTSFYENTLGRAPDTAGLAYWEAQLNAAGATPGSVIGDMIYAVTNYVAPTTGTAAELAVAALGTTSKNLFDNKAAVAEYYGLSNGNIAGATTALNGVTADAATVVTAEAAIDNAVAVAAGQIYPLTTGIDTFTGGAGIDTFNAIASDTGATTDTFGVSDALVGGAGTDVINIAFSGTNAATALAAATVSGIETVNLRALLTTAATVTTVDAGNFTGATAVNADRATSAVTITNLAAGASAGMIGNGSATNGALIAGYKAAATAATLNISGGTTAGALTVTGTGLLATTINSTGADNVIGNVTNAASSKALTINATTGLETGTISTNTAVTAITINATGDVTTGTITAAAALTTAITGTGAVTTQLSGDAAPTITVSGSGDVDVGTLNAASTTLTSTQTAGSLTVIMNAVATSKVTGGAGDDTITAGAVLTTGAVNGGNGTDTLVLGTNVNYGNTSGLAAKYTNFETLSLNGTMDMSLWSGIQSVVLSGATNALTGMTATQAGAVTASADIGTTTLALLTATGTSDVLTVTMGAKATTGAAATNAAGALTVTGFETVNIIANPGSKAATAGAMLTTIASFGTPTTLSQVNLTGSAVAITDAATTVATTFNASGLTGDANATNLVTAAATKGLTLLGNLVAGSTVTGSDFIDTITFGTVGSTYNLGAGKDAISSTLAHLLTGTTYNTLDAGAGVDTLTITDGTALTLVDDDFKGLTNLEKITISTTTTHDQSITTGGWFDANFKAAGATLTTTSTTGAIVVAEGSFTGTNAVTASSTTGAITISGGTGDQTITATSTDAGGGGLGVITITTLGGNDVVTVTTAATTLTSTISTGAGNDTIVGSLGVETITGGTGADTMTGGGGADTFVFGSTGSVIGTSLDVITDFNTGGSDVLSFTSATLLSADVTTLVAGSNVNQTAGGLVTFATADNTLALKIVAIQADTQLDAAGSVAFFVDGGNTYVYYAGTATGNADDQLIQLTGVTGLTTITDGGTTITIG